VASPPGGRQRIATVAAPRYLTGRTSPRRPEDLSEHRCLNARLGTGPYRWEYGHKGRDFDIEPPGPLLTNDAEFAIAAARAGVQYRLRVRS
jgi:DNA-binding transcriptional LysR family regulator